MRRLAKPGPVPRDSLSNIMNDQVRSALGIDAYWVDSSGAVFSALYEDFMKPVTDGGKIILKIQAVTLCLIKFGICFSRLHCINVKATRYSKALKRKQSEVYSFF